MWGREREPTRDEASIDADGGRTGAKCAEKIPGPFY
jgi:hypothetical protein